MWWCAVSYVFFMEKRTVKAIRALGHYLGGKSFHEDDEIKDEVEKCGSDNRRQPSMAVAYKSLCTDLTNVWIMGVIMSKNNK
ncbi:hypothetical protein TNCV_2611101 [Trichonephila clavipes]|nr:hypothetical protein TNCV_2611101 [Trichonephila clavipes]